MTNFIETTNSLLNKSMKLTKDKLISRVKISLEKLGYSFFKESITGAQGFFSKKLENGFYLSLGLTIDRYSDEAFCGTFYYSKTVRWSAVWGDIPDESYIRPGHLLSEIERKDYFNTNNKNLYDYWWNGFEDLSIAHFVEIIKLTEVRLLNNNYLKNRIEDSIDVSKLSNYSSEVKKTVVKITSLNSSYSFIPDKEIDRIPMEWFKAAEYTLKKHKGILNKNTVKSLAADAFIQNILDNKI